MLYDKIIIGAGLYGLYAALFCAKREEKVLVLEWEQASFTRATYINQARVHKGYHYPRSLSTAMKSAGYYKRFLEDYGFCIYDRFEQVYATSGVFSWTDSKEFSKFCKDVDIRCEAVPAERYFREGMCDGAFLTEECTYDAQILRDYFLVELEKYSNVKIQYNARIERIEKAADRFEVISNLGKHKTPFVLNATYASTNQLIDKLCNLEKELFPIKYELCEVILCKVSKELENIGITVMDGPFFSIMPFGKTGYHSLTSVTFTPHTTSYDDCPTFVCQKKSQGYCSPQQLGNCNECIARPDSAWDYMSNLARKYLKEVYSFERESTLFSMKPILQAAEIDDSRPTVIRRISKKPTFVSVLSGKINTIYDLENILTD